MESNVLEKVAIDCHVEVMGHVFKNLKEIQWAVGKRARLDNTLGGRHIYEYEPKDIDCPEGMFVLDMFEPFPKFDYSDYMYDHREFHNYFFSERPFTDEIIEEIAAFRCLVNYRIVNEYTPVWALPAIYYSEDEKTMIVAKPGN